MILAAEAFQKNPFTQINNSDSGSSSMAGI